MLLLSAVVAVSGAGVGAMVIVGAWVLSVALGYAVGSSRGRGAAGMALGAFLGPAGVLAALFLPSGRVRVRDRRRVR